MNYSDILDNEHFLSLAALVRSTFRSPNWRHQHPDVPFWTLWRNLDNVTPVNGPPWNRNQVLTAFTALLTALVEADPRLSYTTDDIAWLVSVLDDAELQKVTISLWMAYATAPADLLTPAEAANATDTSESYWRNRAAAGEIPGAYKKGKQWLLPRAAVESKQKTSDD